MEQRDSNREVAAFILRGYSNFLRSQQTDFYKFFKKTHMEYCTSLKLFYPINVEVLPHESASVLDIIESDNKILNKILGVFAVLCNEIKDLQAEAFNKQYVFVAFYGEFFQKLNCSPSESIANQIESFISLSTFVKRCQDVVSNLCNQIVSLYSSNLINIKGVKLNYVLTHLGDLLLVLVTLDCLIHCSPLQNHWTEYRKSLKKISNADKMKKSSETLKSLETVLNNLGDNILSDKIFYNSYHALRKIKATLNKKNIIASEDYMSYLKKCIMDMEKSPLDQYESLNSIQWVKINILFVFHFHIFGNVDKKLFKSLCDINIKIHSVPLFGLAVWHPEQFLLQHASVLCSTSSKMTQNTLKARQTYVMNKKHTLLKDVYFAQLQSCKWTLEMLQVFSTGESQLSGLEMNNRLELLLQGIKFVSQINFFITCFMSIHITQGMPITKSLLMGICKFIEILKGIQSVFKLKFASILSSVNLITQHLLFQIISQLVQVKKNMMADKNYATQRLDELSAIVIAERALNGPMTNLRRIVTNVALSLVPSSAFSDDNYQKVLLLLEKLDNVIEINSKMNLFCDCSFIYWHKSVIQIYLQNIFDGKKDMVRLKCIIDAMNDCDKNIQIYSKTLSKSDYLNIFHNEIKEYFDDGILKPLSQQVETNLRLHVHSHLQLDSMNPFTVPVEDNTSLLNIQNLRFSNENLYINNAIEHYLSYMFYNLTTVVLHDWKTYGEMRQLAKFKFNLYTVEDNLPTQTLEQGLDVLEIMRNIHVFVSKYLYNLNNQVFIEKSSNNKYLNTINIRHIANSIRTHGIGIMNTTVNFTYQFLKKKFHTFSQFMYDEQIKSRLIKDMRYFKEACAQSEQMYSYKRAEKFNKGIRNLGLDNNGQSYLDLFRLLISEIGNAMGYVRMIRSGGLHCCANSTVFLPSLNDDDYYFLNCENDDIQDLVKESLKNLETTISHLTSNFSNGTDYFKLLVDVFSPAFRKSDNIHLKSFFMIVPPLTLNFVEHMLLAKDKMNKKNKIGAAFTDDGFAMGLAYILKLLDQEEGMDSLNWFQSVNKHIEEERKSIKEQLINHSNHLQDALALTEKKLNLLEQEFQLLYFSFSSARIFFQ